MDFSCYHNRFQFIVYKTVTESCWSKTFLWGGFSSDKFQQSRCWFLLSPVRPIFLRHIKQRFLLGLGASGGLTSSLPAVEGWQTEPVGSKLTTGDTQKKTFSENSHFVGITCGCSRLSIYTSINEIVLVCGAHLDLWRLLCSLMLVSPQTTGSSQSSASLQTWQVRSHWGKNKKWVFFFLKISWTKTLKIIIGWTFRVNSRWPPQITLFNTTTTNLGKFNGFCSCGSSWVIPSTSSESTQLLKHGCGGHLEIN